MFLSQRPFHFISCPGTLHIITVPISSNNYNSDFLHQTIHKTPFQLPASCFIFLCLLLFTAMQTYCYINKTKVKAVCSYLSLCHSKDRLQKPSWVCWLWNKRHRHPTLKLRIEAKAAFTNNRENIQKSCCGSASQTSDHDHKLSFTKGNPRTACTGWLGGTWVTHLIQCVAVFWWEPQMWVCTHPLQHLHVLGPHTQHECDAGRR